MRLDRPARALRGMAFRLCRRIAVALPGGRIDAFGADASRMVLAILDNHAAIAATDIHKV